MKIALHAALAYTGAALALVAIGWLMIHAPKPQGCAVIATTMILGCR